MPANEPVPTTFAHLDRGQRRRLFAGSILRIAATTLALLIIYGVMPVVDEPGARALIELFAGLAVFAAILGWQVRSIVNAKHPEVRAAEALAVAIPVLVIVFAFTYLSLSASNGSSFTEPLDHISAFYFTVTTLGTVGYGDIAARTDTARVLVTIQILLDLVIVVGIARTVVFAARVGVRRQQEQRSADED